MRVDQRQILCMIWRVRQRQQFHIYFIKQFITFELIAATARRYDIHPSVFPTFRNGNNMVSREVTIFVWFTAIKAEVLVAAEQGGVGQVWHPACEIKNSTFTSHDRVQDKCRLHTCQSRSSASDGHTRRAERPGDHPTRLQGHRIFPVQPFDWGASNI